MTTETPAPLTAFRDSRQSMLNSLMSGMTSLEGAVIEFEAECQRRVTAAEAETARAGREVERLRFDLGNARELLETRGTGDGAELAAARRETERLEAELAEVRANAAAEPEADPRTAEELRERNLELDRLRADLEAAEQAFGRQGGELAAAQETVGKLQAELADVRAAGDLDVEGFERQMSLLQEENNGIRNAVAASAAAASAKARSEVLGVLALVAADSPDVPLQEAMEMVTIAVSASTDDTAGIPAPVETLREPDPIPVPEDDQDHDQDHSTGEQEPAQEPPEPETAALPSAPADGEEDFFNSLPEPVVTAPAPARPTPLDHPQLMFDINAPLDDDNKAGPPARSRSGKMFS